MAKDQVERRVDEVCIVIHEKEPLLVRHGTVCQLEAGYELHLCQPKYSTLEDIVGKYLHRIQLPAERS